MLQVADVFTNGPNTVADEFQLSSSTGTNNTVNVGTTTALFIYNYGYNLSNNNYQSDTTYDPNGYSTPANAFDKNNGTYASKNSTTATTYYLGKTFSARTIKYVNWSIYASAPSGYAPTVTLDTYDGATWSYATSICGVPNGGSISHTGSYYLNSSVQGIRIVFPVANTSSTRVHELSYGDYQSSTTVICDASTITLDGTEKAIIVSTPDTTFDTGTSMTVIASDGTLSTSAQTINTTSKNTGVFSITSLGSGTLKLTFTLATSDTSKSPLFKGYGVYVIR